MDVIELITKNLSSSINKYQNASIAVPGGTSPIKIFKEYPVFGVGIKNFRHESGKPKYFNEEYSASIVRQSTHPHQIHLEFLSETGIVGYLVFVMFFIFSIIIGFRNYYYTKNW